MFVPELEVKIWVKTPPGTEGHTKGSQTLPAAFIFWVGFLHKDKAPRTKSGLGAKDCAQKSAGNASPTPYGFTPKAHGILWGFTASPSFWDSLHAPIHSNLPKAHQATKYLCFFSVLGVFLAPHWAHCHSRNYQLIFPTRNGPETDAAALGRAKHCDKQGQCQQLYLKHAPELGVWDTFLAASIQLCPSSQSTSHLSHLDHVNKENSEVYQVFPTTGLRSQVPDILEPELNSFPWPNSFPLATSVLMFAEMFNYYEKWNFNRASDDSKKQLVVKCCSVQRSLHFSCPHPNFNKCLQGAPPQSCCLGHFSPGHSSALFSQRTRSWQRTERVFNPPAFPTAVYLQLTSDGESAPRVCLQNVGQERWEVQQIAVGCDTP